VLLELDAPHSLELLVVLLLLPPPHALVLLEPQSVLLEESPQAFLSDLLVLSDCSQELLGIFFQSLMIYNNVILFCRIYTKLINI